MVAFAVTTIVAAALLAGCGTSRPVVPPPVTSTSVEQPTVSETPTQSAMPIDTPSAPDAGATPDLVGSQTVTTEMGYVIEVSWKITNPTFYVDTAGSMNAPPGQTYVRVNADGSFELTITNLTPGKNANADVWQPFGEVLMTQEALVALFPDSPPNASRSLWKFNFAGDMGAVLGPNESATFTSHTSADDFRGTFNADEGDQAVSLFRDLQYWLYLNGDSTISGQDNIRIPIGWGGQSS